MMTPAPGAAPGIGDDRGSVLLLGVGLVAVCLLAVVALVDVSAAFLQRQQLMAVADAAALAAAQSIDLPAYYESGAGAETRLEPALVAPRVRQYLDRSQAARSIEGLRLERAWSDGAQAVVALSSPLRLPFMSAVFAGDVSVESWAQLAYRDAPASGR